MGNLGSLFESAVDCGFGPAGFYSMRSVLDTWVYRHSRNKREQLLTILSFTGECWVKLYLLLVHPFASPFSVLGLF